MECERAEKVRTKVRYFVVAGFRERKGEREREGQRETERGRERNGIRRGCSMKLCECIFSLSVLQVVL